MAVEGSGPIRLTRSTMPHSGSVGGTIRLAQPCLELFRLLRTYSTLDIPKRGVLEVVGDTRVVVQVCEGRTRNGQDRRYGRQKHRSYWSAKARADEQQ